MASELRGGSCVPDAVKRGEGSTTASQALKPIALEPGSRLRESGSVTSPPSESG